MNWPLITYLFLVKSVIWPEKSGTTRLFLIFFIYILSPQGPPDLTFLSSYNCPFLLKVIQFLSCQTLPAHRLIIICDPKLPGLFFTQNTAIIPLLSILATMTKQDRALISIYPRNNGDRLGHTGRLGRLGEYFDVENWRAMGWTFPDPGNRGYCERNFRHQWLIASAI